MACLNGMYEAMKHYTQERRRKGPADRSFTLMAGKIRRKEAEPHNGILHFSSHRNSRNWFIGIERKSGFNACMHYVHHM